MSAQAYEEHCYAEVRSFLVYMVSTEGLREPRNEAGQMYGMGRLRKTIRRAAVSRRTRSVLKRAMELPVFVAAQAKTMMSRL